MTKWVQHFALYVLGLFFFYIPFEYKRAREESRSHAGATCYVALLYLLFVLWIGGFANALYGLGMVIDRPASIVGLIASSPAKASGKVRRLSLLADIGLMSAGSVIGRAAEKQDEKRQELGSETDYTSRRA
jgi:hypothetical protein